jgi:hypothetical protein
MHLLKLLPNNFNEAFRRAVSLAGTIWLICFQLPVSAGSFSGSGTAKITFTGSGLGVRTNTVTLAAEQTLTISITATDKEYDGNTDATVTTSISGLIEGDDVTVNVSDAHFDTKNVGTGKTVTSSFSLTGPDAAKYTFNISATATADIYAKELTITGASVVSKAYDGTNIANVKNATLSGIVGTENVSLDDATSGTYADANIGIGKAVTTALTIKGTAAGNYSLAQPVLTGDITPMRITIVTTPGQSKEYGDADPIFTYTTVPALIAGDVLPGLLTKDYGEQVGDYFFYFEINSGGINYTIINYMDNTFALTPIPFNNYEIIDFIDNPFSIIPKPITVTADAKSKVYGTDDPYLSYTITPALEIGLLGSLARSEGNDVGEYTINQGTLSGGDYYTITSFTANTFTITPKPITVTAEAKSKMYGEADPEFTYRTSPALITGDALSGALSRTAGSDVGTYSVNQGNLNSKNYTITFVGNSLRITPKPITVTADRKSKVYGDADPEFTYTTSPALVAGDALSGLLSRSAGADVSRYPINQGSLNSENYSIGFVENYLEITRKPITVTADAKSKVYGEADPVLTYTVNPGLVSGDVFTGELSRSHIEPVGTYPIYQSSLSPGYNYTVDFHSADLTITPKELTVENAVVATKVYDGTTSATITGATLSPGVVGNDNAVLDYNTTGTFDNADVGTGKTVTTVMEIIGSNGGNYTLKQPTLTGTITPKELTYVLTAETKYYDGTTNAVVSTIGVNGLLYGDIVTVNATNGNFDTKNVGKNKTVTADISLSGSSAGNYTCKPTATAFADIYNIPLTAQFTISPWLLSYKGGTKVLLTLTYPKPLDVIEGSPNIGINGIGLSISEPFVTTDRKTWTYEWTVPTSGSGEVKFTAAVPDIAKNFSQLTTGQTVLVVDNSVTGIPTFTAEANVKVYPTVNQGEFKIHMSNPETGVVNVKIVSMSGLMVQELKFNKSLPEETFIVNIGTPTAGIYMVEVSLDGYTNVKKMIVK